MTGNDQKLTEWTGRCCREQLGNGIGVFFLTLTFKSRKTFLQRHTAGEREREREVCDSCKKRSMSKNRQKNGKENRNTNKKFLKMISTRKDFCTHKHTHTREVEQDWALTSASVLFLIRTTYATEAIKKLILHCLVASKQDSPLSCTDDENDAGGGDNVGSDDDDYGNDMSSVICTRMRKSRF